MFVALAEVLAQHLRQHDRVWLALDVTSVLVAIAQ